jgi:hypothetical protein
MSSIYVAFEKTRFRTRILRTYRSREKAKAYIDSHAGDYAKGSPETDVTSKITDYDAGHYGIRVNEFTAEAGDCWTIFGFEKCEVFDD